MSMVSVGSCLFTESGFLLTQQTDPTRIAAQVVSGIGFLGAGAILRGGRNVTGLTTAATIWVVAAIGMAAGFGAYLLAVGCTALVLITLIALLPLRRRMFPGQAEPDEPEIGEKG